jgi:hypothetical protein
MNRTVLERCIAWLLLIVGGLIILHAPLTVWLVSQGAPVYVKAWKELLMALAAVLLLIHAVRLRALSRFRRDPILWVAGAYGLVNLIMAICLPTTPEATLAGLAINLRFVLYFVLVYVFLKLHPGWRDSFVRIGLLGAGVVVGFALLQLVLPADILKHLGYSDQTIAPYLTVDDNPAFIRENSTLRGPNPLGAYAGSVAVLAVAYMTSKWRELKRPQHRFVVAGVLVASLVALWVSYSRSALIGTCVGIALVVALRVVPHMRRIHWVTLGVGTLVLACAAWAVRDSSFVQNVVLHDNPTTGASIDSNGDHVNSLGQGWARMVAQPFGAGVGSTGSASLIGGEGFIIENQYLMIAHEVGWLGLGLFVWLYWCIMQALWRRRDSWLGLGVWASGLSLALIGFVLPVWADDVVSIVWWGLAALAIATIKEGYGTTTHKKTT